MSHPFQVAGRYRNLKGAYIVESLGGSHMVIRYDDGRVETTSTTFQDLALLPNEPVTASSAPGGKSAAPRTFDFQGLKETDFQDGTAGTSWRRRASLGGLLAHRLSSLAGQPYESLGVSRRNEVYVYQPHRYRKEATYHEAKLFFAVGPDGVHHGLYVEKGYAPLDASWDWNRLLVLKAERTPVGVGVFAAMRAHQLVWRLEFFNRDRSADRTRFVDLTGDSLALRDEPGGASMTWDAFLDFLAALPADERCDLYLEQFIGRGDAIRLGVRIAEQVAPVWRDLTPLYRACTETVRRRAA